MSITTSSDSLRPVSVTTQKGGALIPNPWNQIIAQRHAMLGKAQRTPLGTLCDPTGQPITSAKQRRVQLKTVPLNLDIAGDNIVIPALAGVKEIFEMLIWNVGAQTVTFQQGITATTSQLQWFELLNFPALTAMVLGFNGNFEQPHFEVDNNQPFVINLSAGSPVTGFIRYRINTGTN